MSLVSQLSRGRYETYKSRFLVSLKVGGSVNLARLMVVLQRRLERRGLVLLAAADRSGRLMLLDTTSAHVVVHQTIMLFVVTSASPDSVANEAQSSKNNSTADANDNANNSLLGSFRHAR